MTAPFVVAQLLIQSDGLTFGGSDYIVPDWPRKRIHLFSQTLIRTYTTDKMTQLPLHSVATAPIYIYAIPGLDPQSGDILCLGNSASTAFPSNVMHIFRVSPETGAVTDHNGTMSSLGSYPSGVWVPESLVGVVCGSMAYAISKEDAFSGEVCAHRATSPMIHAGHEHYIVSNSRVNRANLCAGASGDAGASAFLIDTNNPHDATVNVYYVKIAPGAETYNPASWPATNPYITSGTLRAIPMGEIDPAYGYMTGSAIGYDSTDGNIIIDCNGDSRETPQRIAKINAETGEVMWSTVARIHTQNLQATRITDGKLWILGGNLRVSTVIDTMTGADTVVPLTGLDFSSYRDVVYDGANLAVFRGTYATGGSGNAFPAEPAPGTGSFNGFGIIWPLVKSPIALDNLLVEAELPPSEGLIYRWRSRQFYNAAPTSLGAVQISLDEAILRPAPSGRKQPTLANPRAGRDLSLPSGVNALFRIFVGPDGENLFYTKTLDQERMVFRLPSGLKAFNWQFEVISRVPIYSVELASTMRELKKV